MSRSSKSKSRTEPQPTPLAEVDVTAPPVEADDDFLAPQDIVGDDLAAQLQTVLDEARAQLNADPPVAAAVKRSLPAEAALDIDDDAFVDVAAMDEAMAGHVPWGDDSMDDDAMFESPDQVLSGSGVVARLAPQPVAGAPVANAADAAAMVEEKSPDFDAELRQLMEMTGGEAGHPGSEVGQAGASDSPVKDSIDATGQQAHAVGAQVDQMSRLIEEAVAPAGAMGMHQAAREIHQATSPAASQVDASTATMKQLDEFLADHADHAVADEFETIQDVLSEATATQSPAAEAMASHSQATASQEDDEFDSPEQLLKTDGTPFHPSEPRAAGAGDASASISDLENPAAVGASSAASAAKPRASVLMKVGAILLATKKRTYQVCCALNKPLQHASASTRWNIGMIGLISLANASVLLLGKLLNIWG